MFKQNIIGERFDSLSKLKITMLMLVYLFTSCLSIDIIYLSEELAILMHWQFASTKRTLKSAGGGSNSSSIWKNNPDQYSFHRNKDWEHL